MAVASSILLAFSTSNTNDAQYLIDNSPPTIASEYNDTQNFKSLIKHYPDLRDTVGEVISLKELSAIPVGEEICDTMVSQGLAIKDGMILITAYDGIEGYKSDLRLHSYRREFKEKLNEEKEHKVHNSVIVVLDQETKEILTTIELADKNHVGGIAVDDENAYIAKSADGVISVISLDKIKEAAKKGKEEGIRHTSIDYDYNMPCNCDASIVSLRETLEGKKQLLIGTWIPFPGVSILRTFDFGENNDLILDQKFSINSACNGASFVKRDGKEFLIVACSMGRSLNSNLFVYEVGENEKGKIELSYRSKSNYPPMMEEITEYVGNDGKRRLAINSEAFSERYSIGRSNIISNGIIITDLDRVLDKKGDVRKNAVYYEEDIYKEEEENDDKKRKNKKKEMKEIDK